MSILAQRIWDRINEEPALASSLVNAALALWISFGHVVSQEQQGAISAIVGILLAILVRGAVLPTAAIPVEGISPDLEATLRARIAELEASLAPAPNPAEA